MSSRFLGSILGVLALAACSGTSAPLAGPAAPGAASSTPSAPTPSDPKAALAGATLILDVRSADEHAQGHLADDLLIPVQELEGRLAEVEAAVKGDKAAKVVAYCRSGRRAEQARQVLMAHGFSNVVNAGGYDELR